MPARYDDSHERNREHPSREPEPLQLPLDAPRSRTPERRDEAPAENEFRVIVIDLA